MSKRYLYIDNDMLLILDEFKSTDGVYLNAATVTATLYDLDSVEVSGQTWPLSLQYVTDSNGKYTGILQDTCELTENAKYVLHVDALADGYKSHWEGDVWAVRRTF